MPINFRSKLHQALLGYYFTNPDAEHYIRELSRLLSFDATYLARELKLLSRSGLFLASTHHREKYFRLNKQYQLYGEIRALTFQFVAKKATNKKSWRVRITNQKRQSV